MEQSATPVRLTGLHVARLERWMCGCGAVAQLGERLVRNEEVSGSIPLSSTKESTQVASVYQFQTPDGLTSLYSPCGDSAWSALRFGKVV